jgi:hypothetical protein
MNAGKTERLREPENIDVKAIQAGLIETHPA